MNFKSFFAAAVVTVTMIGQVSAKNAPAENVNTKAQAAFASEFPGASDLKWATDKKEGYVAYFTEAGARKVANLDKDGNITTVITYFKPGQEPADVKTLLAGWYPNMKLSGLTGIEVMGGEYAGVYYQANLEDAKHWYFVGVNGNSVQVNQILDKE